MRLHLDTHVAVWLAAGETRRLRPVQKRLRAGTLLLSPVVVVELEILREIGRITAAVSEVVRVLREEFDVTEAAGNIADIARAARPLGWTRDPFDRFIVAHAMLDDAILLTADERIRVHCTSAVWGS